jgi:hypothetical protein
MTILVIIAVLAGLAALRAGKVVVAIQIRTHQQPELVLQVILL